MSENVLSSHNRKWKILMVSLIVAAIMSIILLRYFDAVFSTVWVIGFACLLAILARITQAHYHHRELLGNPE
ncbi:MAG: hypothetical protein VX966_03315 [Chloroflexota bacterium]|nr:hypothetical protein [Chloroflexota bacterium]